MKRWLTLGLFTAFIAAIGIAVYTLLYTPAGLQWTLRQLQARVPGQLTVTQADGRLAGPLHIAGLQYENDSLSIRAENLVLRWRPGRLVDGVLAIDELTVGALDIATKPMPAPTGDGIDIRLPLDVEIRRLGAGNIVLRLPEQEPVSIDSIDASASARTGLVNVSALRLRARALELDAEGELPLNMRDDLQLGLRWRTSLQERTLAGDGTVGGTWRRLTTEMRLTQPLTMHVTGRLETGGDTPRWGVHATADPFAPSALLPEAPPGRVTDATLEASGTGTVLSATGGLTWHDERYGPWSIVLDAGWDGSRWEFPRIDLHPLDGTMRIGGSAQLWRGDDGRYSYDVAARWQDLIWPPEKSGLRLSPQGTLSLSGTAAQYKFRAAGALTPPGVPPLTLRLAGRGDQHGFTADELAGEWLQGAWTGHGELAWSPALRWDATLAAQHANPAAYREGFDGKLDVAGRVHGEYAAGALALDIDMEQLAGTLRGYPLLARAQIGFRPGEFRVDGLQLRSGAAALALDARFGADWQLDWKLDAPQLAELYPELAGSLQTQGRISGPRNALRGRIELDARQASYRGFYAGTLQARADVDTAPAGLWQISARAEDAGTREQHRSRLALDITGTSQDHAVLLSGVQEGHRMVQQLHGSLQDRRWRARLHDGQIELARLGLFAQQGTSELTVAADAIALESWCWRQEETLLCLDGSGNPATADLQATLAWRGLDLARLAALAPESDIALEGSGTGEARISVAAGVLQTLSANLDLQAGAVSYTLPTDATQRHTLRFREAGLQVDGAAGTGLRAEVRIGFEDGAHIAADLQLPQWDPATPTPGPEQPLAGSGEIGLQELSAISLFIPALQPGPGRLQTSFALSGTLADPRVDGELDLELSTLTVARLGISLQDLKLHAKAEQNRWELQGSLRSGTGELTLDGSGYIENGERWESTLALKGKLVEILRVPAAVVSASPDMTIRFRPGELEIAGTLAIPKAQLEPVMAKSGAGVSEDVVIAGREERAAAPKLRVHGNLELVLGDEVGLAAMGVKGRLTGHLSMLINSIDDISGRGEIRLVDGRFQAYGQDLAIERGLILFAGGPIEDPALDIVASRVREKEIEEVKVGVRVSGTAEQPVLTLFSDPAMDESDILSYLVIGRPLNEASASEGESLYKEAATSISLAGSETIAKTIGGTFNLTEVNIESGKTAEDTSLVLGKSVSPRLYIRYVQGLVEESAMFQIRYRLSNKWTLQTESGTTTATGADLIYSFER